MGFFSPKFSLLAITESQFVIAVVRYSSPKASITRFIIGISLECFICIGIVVVAAAVFVG